MVGYFERINELERMSKCKHRIIKGAVHYPPPKQNARIVYQVSYNNFT